MISCFTKLMGTGRNCCHIALVNNFFDGDSFEFLGDVILVVLSVPTRLKIRHFGDLEIFFW